MNNIDFEALLSKLHSTSNYKNNKSRIKKLMYFKDQSAYNQLIVNVTWKVLLSSMC